VVIRASLDDTDVAAGSDKALRTGACYPSPAKISYAASSSSWLDENEFLSPYGIRALSRAHYEVPYRLRVDGTEYTVKYEPAESSTGIFGGNSNWRGPIWFPVNVLLIESLQKFHHYLGDDFKVECPTGSGIYMNLWEVAAEISKRLTRLFLRGEDGRRPVYGKNELYHSDSPLARPDPVLRIFPRRRRLRSRREPSDRLDRRRRQTHAAKRRIINDFIR